MEWHDPYAQDDAAREREARRAEREAKRRERQQSLADKVGAHGDDSRADAAREQEPASAPPPPPAPAAQAPKPVVGHPVGPTSRALTARRIIGLGVLIAALVLAFFAAKAIKSVFDDDAPAAPPPKPLKTQEFTIPEGMDRTQIADLAEEAGIKGDYLKASKKAPKGFDLAEYGAQGALSLEGFLFPAQYELTKNATAKELVAKQLSEGFEARIGDIDMSYAKSKNLNVYDVLKIASMIEREVAVPKERPLVAEVIYNRLEAGTPLGIDATIRYYLHKYDGQLTESELAEDQPYNSRIVAGLPPTPIGNPGLDSIEAAANPAKGDLFYFVIKPGTCNEHVFVETQQEFDQAEAAYQQALAEQGGSPTEC